MKRLLGLSLLGMLMIPQLSSASIFIGGPYPGNGWSVNLSQATNETWFGNTVGPYDYIRLDWVSGSLLEPSGLRNFNNGWSAPAYGQTSTFSWATGPSGNFNFSMTFADPIQTTVVRYFVYDDDELKQAQEFGFNSGGGFQYVTDLQGHQAPGRMEGVPEPSTLAVLVGAGLLGLIPLARRRKRQ